MAFSVAASAKPIRLQRLQPRRGLLGQQTAGRLDLMVEMIEDQARIDQQGAVVLDKGRRLDHRVDLREFVELAKHRHAAMLERQVEHGQRNRYATHIGGVQHADQLHS
jgi:hypothetical protein